MPIPDFSHKTLRRIASATSLGVALILIVIKFWAWFSTGSISLLTSAVDALVDAAASLVTFAGVLYAERPADSGHRYGHGKAEAVAAFVQSILLAGAAVGLGAQSVSRLITPEPLEQVDLGIWVVVASTFVAAALVLMQTYVVKKTGSTAIAADRAHYVTDVAVNLAVLFALGLTRLTGWASTDPAVALGISCYMLWTARGIAAHALIPLLDRELGSSDRARIRAAILGCDGVEGVHDLRTRDGGDRVFIEFHVEVDAQLPVIDGHAIGDAAENAVKRLFSQPVDVMAHLEPAGIDDERLDYLVEPVVD